MFKSHAKPVISTCLLRAFLFISICGQYAVPSSHAGPYPGTGAPLLLARQLTASGDPGNPFSYPILKSIARSLVRNGFPATFFLGLEGKAGPGIDLRTILLYEAGVLKSPVKLLLPPRPKKQDGFPALSVTSIPESSGEMPSAAPKLSAPASLESNPAGGAKSGAAESALPAAKIAAAREEAPLNLDFNKFSMDLSNSRLNNELTSKVESEPRFVAMTQPLSLDQPQNAASESAFRFWTIPRAPALPKSKEKSGFPYTGSFVMVSAQGLKAVEGRMFFLGSGRILACSRAKSIKVNTPVAQVTVEPGATAYIEIVKPGSCRVRVLEAQAGEHSVGVKFNSMGKGEDIRLAAAEDLLVADHSLNDAEKSIQGKSGAGGTAGGGECWSRSVCTPKALFDGDKFFSSDETNQNAEQRSAVLSLKNRLK